MDALSQQLLTFLITLAENPHCVSHKIIHYVEHLLHLLPANEEKAMLQLIGLFDEKQRPLEEIAKSMNTNKMDLETTLLSDLRKLAITPEWQMLQSIDEVKKIMETNG